MPVDDMASNLNFRHVPGRHLTYYRRVQMPVDKVAGDIC
jgi:hypothetical protein